MKNWPQQSVTEKESARGDLQVKHPLIQYKLGLMRKADLSASERKAEAHLWRVEVMSERQQRRSVPQ